MIPIKNWGVKGFTRFYPWTIYYSDRELDYPTYGFGIWFVNGLIKYPSSIRLGLTQYMGSVEKARGYIHKQKENRLFSGKNQNDWAGSKTWLHIIFNKSLKSCLSLKKSNSVFIAFRIDNDYFGVVN